MSSFFSEGKASHFTDLIFQSFTPCFVPRSSGGLTWKQSESRLIMVELIPAPAWVLGRKDALSAEYLHASMKAATLNSIQVSRALLTSADSLSSCEGRWEMTEGRHDEGAGRDVDASGVRRLSIKRTLQGQALPAMCAALRLDPHCGP